MEQTNGIGPAAKAHQHAVFSSDKFGREIPHAGKHGSIKTFFCHIKKYNKYIGNLKKNMKKRILIVEDEAGIIDLLKLVLNREGYEVASCQSGRDAIAAIKAYHPHLVILDVMLPGLDGASIVRIMNEDEMLSSTPVIITSALVESEKMFLPFPQVKGFASKPFVLADLTALVKKAIGDLM